MDLKINTAALRQIQAGICDKYANVASSPKGQFKYPTGRRGLETLNYDGNLIQKLPDAVASSYCGVGNPFSLGNINPGEQVLDIGCGAGVDAILAAIMVGPEGSVAGLDMVAQMIARAEINLRMMHLDNVNFHTSSAERLPFADETFDVAISNGAINLIPDKEAALGEIIRVLKPSGRLMVADQIAAEKVQKDLKARLANWFQ